MLFLERKLSDGAVLSVWQLHESQEQLLQMLDKQQWYIAFLDKVTADGRKKEWLAARVLLKELCGEEKEIGYHANGQPFLLDGSFNISISHTKAYVVILLHPTKRVGVDVERISDRALNVRHKFLLEKALKTIAVENDLVQTTLLWSAKESLFKVINEEEIQFAEQLHIEPFVLQKEGVLSAYETRTDVQQKFSIYYEVFPEMVLTWTCV
jgi:4'-phosphopantetheinyl transferase